MLLTAVTVELYDASAASPANSNELFTTLAVWPPGTLPISRCRPWLPMNSLFTTTPGL